MAHSRDYRRMDLLEFGEVLIRTQDLDPAYVMLRGSMMNQSMLKRWLIAYWCFYHAGAASYISAYTGEDFWRTMLTAAINETPPPVKPGERWPRASERRYFRGPKCIKAVEWFWNQWDTPEEVFDHIVAMSQQPGEHRTEKEVMRVVGEFPLFGPWIGFKVADMLERVAGVPVNFDANIGLMYEEPRKGLMLWQQTCGGGAAHTLEEHYDNLRLHFGQILAPPGLDRPCGPQELETVLCKWKSHMGGHYPVGKDIREIGAALQGWGDTAHHLYMHLPDSMEMGD